MTEAQTPPRSASPPPSSGRLLRTVPSERAIRGLAVASFASQIGIVVTGGAVRLTGSGLGCPEWPRCTSDSLTATREMGIHGAVEFGNRLLTVVLGVIALVTLAAVLATLRSDRPRRDLVVPAAVLLLGIPTQAIIGGMSVWSELNPWVVMLHFMCSAALVGVATVLVRRAQRPRGALPARLGSTWIARLALIAMVIAYVVVYLGTVVTGSGPHAGDPNSPRTGFDVASVTQIHAHGVALLIGLTIEIGRAHV